MLSAAGSRGRRRRRRRLRLTDGVGEHEGLAEARTRDSIVPAPSIALARPRFRSAAGSASDDGLQLGADGRLLGLGGVRPVDGPWRAATAGAGTGAAGGGRHGGGRTACASVGVPSCPGRGTGRVGLDGERTVRVVVVLVVELALAAPDALADAAEDAEAEDADEQDGGDCRDHRLPLGLHVQLDGRGVGDPDARGARERHRQVDRAVRDGLARGMWCAWTTRAGPSPRCRCARSGRRVRRLHGQADRDRPLRAVPDRDRQRGPIAEQGEAARVDDADLGDGVRPGRDTGVDGGGQLVRLCTPRVPMPAPSG